MHASIIKSVSLLLLAAEYVHAHGAITGATGDQGGNGMAIGGKLVDSKIKSTSAKYLSTQSTQTLLEMEPGATHSNKTPPASARIPAFVVRRLGEEPTTSRLVPRP